MYCQAFSTLVHSLSLHPLSLSLCLPLLNMCAKFIFSWFFTLSFLIWMIAVACYWFSRVHLYPPIIHSQSRSFKNGGQIMWFTGLKPSSGFLWLRIKFRSLTKTYKAPPDLAQGLANFPVKGWVVPIWDLVNRTVCVATSQLCWTMTAAVDNMANKWVWLGSKKTSSTKKAVGWIWPVGHNLLTLIYYPLSAFPTLSHTTLPFTVASRASWGRKPPRRLPPVPLVLTH